MLALARPREKHAMLVHISLSEQSHALPGRLRICPQSLASARKDELSTTPHSQAGCRVCCENPAMLALARSCEQLALSAMRTAADGLLEPAVA